ncbi:hypothetical protein HS088_TW09G00869 [Tripterygium wilfordii]|uniref:CBF1-interacting co-repressor CIR N-terminal domain-containing protein n=1 Tax=Tripterygium wilfordii TaxID=458696 RepID=A0A7J7D988_TRIWF|nr:pre-mRNA-splicing factor CWC25 homolog [Tripterygium wilfordii]KAF5742809.1 hypothetical protein HS088_TW09G00869 [Tripterygium wilfordii]
MALKFLNKKGWHTGSLRNIENVWKAEQKHDQEQKKLEELRKQIREERERSEFRLLQEQAGLVPKQERLDFLYDSGLSVGRGAGSSDKGGVGVAFKAAEEALSSKPASTDASASNKQAPVLGALFEDKPQSANDAWRKLHSDPLLMIRQREQESLARIKNNPVQMAIIRKSVETTEQKETQNKKERRKKHQRSSSRHHRSSSPRKDSDSGHITIEREKGSKTGDYKSSKYNDHHGRARLSLADESSEGEHENKNKDYKTSKYREQSANGPSHLMRARRSDDHDAVSRGRNSKHEEYSTRKDRVSTSSYGAESFSPLAKPPRGPHYKRRDGNSRPTDEERAARLLEMQMDGELHEEQRWKRLKKAEEDDSREASRADTSGSRSFLDAAHRSVYGAGKGGSSSIEESVRRRTHYSQGRSEAGEGNAFRR